MAEQDASVAIHNALHKLDQQPNLFYKVEKLKSLKSDLHRLGSNLDRFNSVSELTEVREIAYDVEDAMDNVITDVANTAQQRWRKLARTLLFSRADIIKQLVEKQIAAIRERTASIGRTTDDDTVTCQPSDHEKDLFYLSLSGFPADVHISARQLIQIWVAEGFLDRQGSTPMEEEGREHINWLLEAGFIRQVERGTCGTLKTFKIANDKLDACRSAAEKENFLHVIKLPPPPPPAPAEATRKPKPAETTRLAIDNDSQSQLTWDVIQRSPSYHSKLRSFQIHCASGNVISKTNFQLYYETSKRFLKTGKKEFDSLRVLDLGCLELETVPEVIGDLAHLRYLRLRAPRATRIPPSICSLHNLQTIDMKETERVKLMPVEIWKMKNSLRHLHLGSATALPAPRRANHYDALEKLQTLCGICPDKELKRLMVRAKFPNVSRLRLHANNPINKEEFVSFLNSLDHLYHLRSLTLRGAIEDLPSDWNAFPPSLTKMTLLKTRIPVNRCVETLQNLPNLRYLKLMEESVTGTEMKCAGGGFPALQVLRMESLKDLDSWSTEKGAMRFLRDLKVRKCEKLRRVEAFQPSKELRNTLITELQDKIPEMAV